jgi:hypothetical protein
MTFDFDFFVCQLWMKVMKQDTQSRSDPANIWTGFSRPNWVDSEKKISSKSGQFEKKSCQIGCYEEN